MGIEGWVREFSVLAERESSPSLRCVLGKKHWNRFAERPAELVAQIALESAAGIECLLIAGFEEACQKAGAIDKASWRLENIGLGAEFENSCLALIAGCMGREVLGLGITLRSGRNATMICFGCGLAEDVLDEGLKDRLCEVLESMAVDADLLNSWRFTVLNGGIQSSLMNLAEDVGAALSSSLERRALDRQIQSGCSSGARARI